jgi:hypothetical protein
MRVIKKRQPMKEKNNNHYIEELQEWQENQYNPGHYLGGKIPGNLLYAGRPKLVGIMLVIIGIMTLVPIIFVGIGSFDSRQHLQTPEFILQLVERIAAGAFGLVLTVCGIRKIIQGMKDQPSKK